MKGGNGGGSVLPLRDAQQHADLRASCSPRSPLQRDRRISRCSTWRTPPPMSSRCRCDDLNWRSSTPPSDRDNDSKAGTTRTPRSGSEPHSYLFEFLRQPFMHALPLPQFPMLPFTSARGSRWCRRSSCTVFAQAIPQSLAEALVTRTSPISRGQLAERQSRRLHGFFSGSWACPSAYADSAAWKRPCADRVCPSL